MFIHITVTLELLLQEVGAGCIFEPEKAAFTWISLQLQHCLYVVFWGQEQLANYVSSETISYFDNN